MELPLNGGMAEWGMELPLNGGMELPLNGEWDSENAGCLKLINSKTTE